MSGLTAFGHPLERCLGNLYWLPGGPMLFHLGPTWMPIRLYQHGPAPQDRLPFGSPELALWWCWAYNQLALEGSTQLRLTPRSELLEALRGAHAARTLDRWFRAGPLKTLLGGATTVPVTAVPVRESDPGAITLWKVTQVSGVEPTALRATQGNFTCFGATHAELSLKVAAYHRAVLYDAWYRQEALTGLRFVPPLVDLQGFPDFLPRVYALDYTRVQEL